MKKELTQKLFEEYPNQFKNLKHIECGDGWYEIISRCCSTIQHHLNSQYRDAEPIEKAISIDNFYWTQIKEKFSLLRMYKSGADEFIRGVVDMAENMSGCVCEYSGNKGKLRNRKIRNGELGYAWMKILSDEEATKEGYYIEGE
jgi:hypothetical protein